MAYNLNNEEVGISAEVAIADAFNIRISPSYRERSNYDICEMLQPYLYDIFEIENIPYPKKHIAEGQNAVDFILENGKTLSVKTNQDNIGRSAPQKIGQPTHNTYFKHLKQYLPDFDIKDALNIHNFEDNYYNRAYFFKKISIENIDVIINAYWRNIFDCDYLILLYDIVSTDGNLYSKPHYKVFGKNAELPCWDKRKFSFTQTVDSWTESCTLKYDGVSIGNFQVHNPEKRKCFKFRFDMNGISYLIENELI
ncbi:MAG: hypothetical protein RSF40_09055 [Oscillospiraceae bacterium]